VTNGERDLPVCVDTSNKKVISVWDLLRYPSIDCPHIRVRLLIDFREPNN